MSSSSSTSSSNAVAAVGLPSSALNYESYAAQLLDASVDLATKLALASDVRDSVDKVVAAEYPAFLAAFVPVFEHLLTSVEPAFASDATEQKLRQAVFETIQRVHINEAVRSHAADLMRTLMLAMRKDNEENAVLAIRVIIELHKNFRSVPALEEYVQPFFDFVKEMLALVEDNVVAQIDECEDVTVAFDAGLIGDEAKAPKKLLPSVGSFRVLAECPIILVLLFQIYKRFLNANIPVLVPLILKAISVRAAKQKAYNGPGVTREVRNRAAYAEFIGAQLKIMSFLAFIIRGFSQLLKPNQQLIADSFINLLRDCPSETSAARKELMVATRHILTTDFRMSFIKYLEDGTLFNEDILVGVGMTSKITLRPLAYSMLADLIHHVRHELSTDLISRTVRMYTQHLHDSSFAPNLQTMCAKLLLNLIECVANFEDKAKARALLLRILDAFTRKCSVLKSVFPKLRRQRGVADGTDPATVQMSAKPQQPPSVLSEDIVDVELLLPIHTTVLAEITPLETVKDYKFLFKTLILGLKTIVYGIKTCNQAIQQQAASNGSGAAAPKPFTQDEQALFVTLFVDGLSCFRIFQLDVLSSDQTAGGAAGTAAHSKMTMQANKEEKEILEHFVTVFTLVDAAVFQEVVTSQVEFLFALQLEDATMLAIPQYLLASEVVSSSFAGILLHFLMENLEKLGGPDAAYAGLMLRLFKLAFMAVTLFPESNEVVLKLHIHDLITNSLKLASTATDSNNYFLLLRALFRNIGGGRFELLYKEVLPLLPALLKGLNTLLQVAEKAHMRELFVELCLTVPVRLSVLLPYLGYLTRPLVLALEAGPELVSQGLRTLELCIDNLTQDFLDPILAPHIKELMTALWKHLKPVPYNTAHSHATLRILGKLGGRNRRILLEAANLKFNDRPDGVLLVPVPFKGKEKPCLLQLDTCLMTVRKILKDSSHSSERMLQQAFAFITGTLPLLVDAREGSTNLARYIAENVRTPSTKDSLEAARASMKQMEERLDKDTANFVTRHDSFIDIAKRDAQSETLTALIECAFLAAASPKLQEQARPYLDHLTRHFTLLKVAESAGLSPRALRTQRIYQGIDFIDASCYLDSIMVTLASPSQDVRKVAEESLELVVATATLLMGSADAVPRLAMINALATKCTSSCYSTDWFKKMAGCRGIHFLSSRAALGPAWLLDYVVEFSKGLLNILKDMPAEYVLGAGALRENISHHSAHSLVGKYVPEIQTTLSGILRSVEITTADAGLQEKRLSRRSILLNLLVTELSSSHVAVRDLVHDILQLLAELTGDSVSSILEPVKTRLLAPIFSKPLRALPFPMQIGNIDAIAYCLRLDPPLVSFNEELIRLLHETLAIADADDQALTSKASQHKHSSSLVSLRIVCVQLLSAAMACNDFTASPQLNGIRFRIVQVFFKALYSKSPEVIAAAKDGLKQAIAQQNKLPKELLQTGLRPILLNLSDHKRLTVDGLQGLARLLELLTNYFKVEIGRKLLDHLNQWATPAVLEAAAGKLLDDSNEVKVITNIMEVIHLLPAAAVMFLPDMVRVTIQLEEALRRDNSSPFRRPLLKFLVRFPEEALAFFLERVQDYTHGRLFVKLLEFEEAGPLREQILLSADKVINSCFAPVDPASGGPAAGQTVGVFIIKTLLQFFPQWINQNLTVLQGLVGLWRGAERSEVFSHERGSVELSDTLKWRSILDILMVYARNAPEDLNVLLDIIDVCSQPSAMDFSDVKFFVYDACSGFTVEQKKGCIVRFLQLLGDTTVPNSKKVMMHRLVVLPCLNIAHADGKLKSVLDKEVLTLLARIIWMAQHYQTEEGVYSDRAMQLDLLQLTAFMIERAPELVGEFRKELIRFTWNYVRNDETILRQASFVVLSLFIGNYDTPDKIVVQLFVTLLRSYQSEARILVKQALDILAPSLPLRLGDSPSAGGSGPKAPQWVRWTRKILIDDGHQLPQLVSIWQFVIRHHDLFFPHREPLIQQIVTSLGKLGLTPSATTDTRLLTIDLVDVVLKWERRRLREMAVASSMDVDVSEPEPSDSPRGKRRLQTSPTAANSPRKRLTQSPTSMGAPTTELSYSPAQVGQIGDLRLFEQNDILAPFQSYREIIINYLIRFICTINEPLLRKGLSWRIVELVRGFLAPELWADVNVKIGFLEKYFASAEVNEANATNMPNILQVLRFVFEKRGVTWYVDNLPHLQSCVQKILASEQVKVIDGLVAILAHVYKQIGEYQEQQQQPVPAPIATFTQLVMTLVVEGLQQARNIYGIVMTLSALRPASNEYVPHLMKLFSRLCKDYPPFSSSQAPPPLPTVVSIMCVAIDLLNSKLSVIGDHRKTVVACFALLLERSNDVRIHRTIFETVKGWVFDNTAPVLTTKEKCAMVQKFAILERRTDRELFEDYLNLAIRVYETEAFVRSEMTVRLEPVFLLGTRYENAEIRSKFVKLFEKDLPPSLFVRMMYVFGVQNWEPIGGSFWIRQALDLLIGCVTRDIPVLAQIAPGFMTIPAAALEFSTRHKKAALVSDELEQFAHSHQAFLKTLRNAKSSDLLFAVRDLYHQDSNSAHLIWMETFRLAWMTFSAKERHDLEKIIISLLAREYHLKQANARPNVIQTILGGIALCQPPLNLPPQLIKYVAKTYGTWYVSLEMLDSLQLGLATTDGAAMYKDVERIKSTTYDATAELYQLLSEHDFFFGLWRRRCVFPETNAALSCEQIGMWQRAQSMYEGVQLKARAGQLPFNEAEFTFFEERWISCSKKLQQWDLLMDLAKHENNIGLQLESSWRITDWNADREDLQHLVSIVSDPPTPRTKTYEAFLALSNIEENSDKISELQRVCDEGLQCSLRKWVSMPSIVSQSHVPLLHTFQQYVELQEASHIYLSVGLANVQSRVQAVQELKGTLGTWRDRLPNIWDDIGCWSELVAWRQHVFSVINKAYQPLAESQPTGNSLAYRGYHEIAWIINRFAHVARKHHLVDVCINALTKIYTLPNIEIHDAFLKLREQAKCYFQTGHDLTAGLEVINNTNLGFFSLSQRAEFFALKGIFLSKLDHPEEANQAFSTAIQVEQKLSKGWSAWGQYCDDVFEVKREDLSLAANAISCYLNAAGICKNARSRKFLARVLWLLGFDDESGVLSNAFEAYKGEHSIWYWISFIPQLITSLTRPEAKHAKNILIRIARAFPQSLYFLLRSAKEEFALRPNAVTSNRVSARPAVTEQALPMQMDEDGRPEQSLDTDGVTPNTNADNFKFEPVEDTIAGADGAKADGTATSTGSTVGTSADSAADVDKMDTDEPTKSSAPGAVESSSTTAAAVASVTPSLPRTPLEDAEEIMAILKTGHPLMVLTLETMVDQVLARLKASPEEDVHRIIMALLTDGYQQLIQRVATGKPGERFPLTPGMRSNIEKFLASPYVQAVKHKSALEADFLRKDLDIEGLVESYAKWRDTLEHQLEYRPRQQHLEHFSHYLVEFEHQRFDEVEIPGQYLSLRDNNSDFVRLDRFQPIIDFGRSTGVWQRRVTMVGHDGSNHQFKVQNPAGRNSRREERVIQLFRIMNAVLEKKKDSRQRNLQFHLPTIVPLAPNVRLVQDDASYVSLHDIMDDHCKRMRYHRDEPLLHYTRTMKAAIAHKKEGFVEGSAAFKALCMEAAAEVGTAVIPDTVLTKYMSRTMNTFSDYWMVRKQFSAQMALISFQTHVMNIGHRLPHKLLISRQTGNILMTELLPLLNVNLVLNNPEAVPFRMTPNIQRFMTSVGVDGVFCGSLVAAAASLCEPEYKLGRFLGLLLRDELTMWQSMPNISLSEKELHDRVKENAATIISRIEALSCKSQRERTDDTVTPVVQPILDHVSDAVNPQNLAAMDVIWHPWM